MTSMFFLFILAFFCLVSLSIGALLFFKPFLAIHIQKKFYALINWNIEPISMLKEIRSTKIMGLLLVIIALFTILIIICWSRKLF
jgi:hypothetical protein